jgi:hypothetical protein
VPIQEPSSLYIGEVIPYLTMTAWVKARRNDKGEYLCVFCDTVLQPRNRYCQRHSEGAYREKHRLRMARYRDAKRQKMNALNTTLPQHGAQTIPWGTPQDQPATSEED